MLRLKARFLRRGGFQARPLVGVAVEGRFETRPYVSARLLVALLACSGACGDDGDASDTESAGRGPGGGEDGGLPDARAAGLDGGPAVDAGRPDAGDSGGGQDPPPIVGSDYVDFGALQPTARGVVQLELDVPDDARSFVLTADPGTVPRDLALLDLRGPSGDLLYDATADPPQPFDPATAQNGSEQLPYAWMLPSSPELALEPGRYRIALYVGPPPSDGTAASARDGGVDAGGRDRSAVRGGPVRVDAVLARGRDREPPRALSLVFWALQGAALDAQAAAADPQLSQALAVMAELFAAAGIAVAPASFRELADPSAPELALLEGDGELARLLALLAEQAGPERALDILLVDELAAEPGKTVLAKVSGVPVPPPHPALARRGAVVLPLASLPAEAARAGALLAHELSHALGLRHTSEFDGLRHDPIADTPACPVERASQLGSAGQPLLSAEDCADLDGSNLLFYTAPQSALSQGALTPGQAHVLSRSPLLR